MLKKEPVLMICSVAKQKTVPALKATLDLVKTNTEKLRFVTTLNKLSRLRPANVILLATKGFWSLGLGQICKLFQGTSDKATKNGSYAHCTLPNCYKKCVKKLGTAIKLCLVSK